MEDDHWQFQKGLIYGTIGTGIIMLLAFEYGGVKEIPDGKMEAGYVSPRDASLAFGDFNGDGDLETLLRIKQTPFEVQEEYDANGDLVLHRRALPTLNQNNNSR